MPVYRVPTPKGEFDVTAPKPPTPDEALSLVKEQHFAGGENSPKISDPLKDKPEYEDKPAERSSYLPAAGEMLGSGIGGAAGAVTPIPGAAAAGAGLGSMIGRTAGSVVAGEGIPPLGELATTGAVNATGEGMFKMLGLAARKAVGMSQFQREAGTTLDHLIAQGGPAVTENAPEFVGRALRDDVLGPAERKVAKRTALRYNKVTNWAGKNNVFIDQPSQVVDVANEFLKRIGDPAEAADPATAKRVVQQLKTVAGFAQKHTSFGEYFDAYRGLQSEFEDFAKLGMPADVTQRVQSSLLGGMKADIDRALKGTPGQSLLTEANRYFDFEKAPFRELVFKPAATTLREEPSRLVNYLAEPGHPERFMTWWRNASPTSRTALRDGWARVTLENAKDPITGAYSAGGLLKAYHGLDPVTRKYLFKGAEKDYEKVFDYLALASPSLRENVAGASGGMVRGFGPGGMTAHGLYSLYRGDVTGAVQSFASAGALSTVMSEPRVMRMLARGLDLKAETPAAIHAGRRAVQAMVSAGVLSPLTRAALGQGYGEALR